MRGLGAFTRFGDEGVDLLLIDSTNAELPGFTTSGRELAPAIDNVFDTAPKRIIGVFLRPERSCVQGVRESAWSLPGIDPPAVRAKSKTGRRASHDNCHGLIRQG